MARRDIALDHMHITFELVLVARLKKGYGSIITKARKLFESNLSDMRTQVHM